MTEGGTDEPDLYCDTDDCDDLRLGVRTFHDTRGGYQGVAVGLG